MSLGVFPGTSTIGKNQGADGETTVLQTSGLATFDFLVEGGDWRSSGGKVWSAAYRELRYLVKDSSLHP